MAYSVVFYVIAYLVGIAAFAIVARRRGMATDGLAILACAGLLGGALGAQVVQFFVGGVPGKSLLGAIAAGYLAVVYAKHRLGIRRHTGDLFAFGLSAGEAVGRIGCLFAGCCYGKETNVAWAIFDHGAFRHPTQLYSGLAALLTLALLIVLERRRVLPEDGILCIQIAVMCALRFPIEFLRDVPPAALGLTATQFACIGAIAFFTYRFVKLMSARPSLNVTPLGV
jgi:phosphatidylglycerol:prolipoprotein diacylglycerol transferase